MKWSLLVARVAGIGIYLHWTFLVLLAWIALVHLSQGDSLSEVLRGVGIVVALFGCVVLHELGHALTARRFGIGTRDITLLPIGGVARLERMPEDPVQELLVAVAGPAVNVVIAGILLLVLVAKGDVESIARSGDAIRDAEFLRGSMVAQLLIVNISLVLFNLLPAFPMDGGRVLRALLAMRMSRVRATHIAANVGQLMAIVFGIFGILSQNWILVFIALFVYLGAQGEAQAVEMRAIFHSVTVRDVMTTRFETLAATDSLEAAARELLAGHQQDFPVLEGEQLAGMLRRTDLFQAMSAGLPTQHVADVMARNCPVVNSSDSLDRAVALMQETSCTSLPVVFQGRVIGLLTSENIGEWTMLQAARRERLARAAS